MRAFRAHMNMSMPINEKKLSRAAQVKTAAAWLLLSLPLAVHPLFWVRVFSARVVAWDRVTLFSLSAMALVAVAVLMLTGLSELRRQCASSKLNLLLVLFAAALLVQSLTRSFCIGRRLEPEEWFLPLMPLAGMALSREIMRILPRWGTLVLGVLIAFTVRFPFYIGLPGNWNWNLSLLAVLLPAPILLWRGRPRQFWIPVLASSVFLGVFSAFNPQLAPRGVIVGVIVASAALWLTWKLPQRQRIFITIIGGAAGIAMFFSIWLGPADSSIRSSRFWLWRGSVELAMKNGAFGCGAGQFEREINPYLPHEYYFSDFATNLHNHPHNELLSAWCAYGLSGIGFMLLLILAAVAGLRNYSSVRVWGFWLFMVLAVHGQFDVLLQTPLAGTLWLVVGGALAGGGGGVRKEKLHPVFGAVGALTAIVFTTVMFMASWYYREGLLSYWENDRYIASKKLEKSLALWEIPDARYLLGRIELFDLRSPAAAIRHFKQLAPGYLHSNLYIGEAYADMKDFKEAVIYLDMESKFFPMSALNAYIKMAVMRESGEDEASLNLRRDRFDYLLKLRGVSEKELLSDHSLDDRPLRNP